MRRKIGHRKPLRYITAGYSAVLGRLLRSPVKQREALESLTPPAIWLPRNAISSTTALSYLVSSLTYVQLIDTLFDIKQERWLHLPHLPSKR